MTGADCGRTLVIGRDVLIWLFRRVGSLASRECLLTPGHQLVYLLIG